MDGNMKISSNLQQLGAGTVEIVLIYELLMLIY